MGTKKVTINQDIREQLFSTVTYIYVGEYQYYRNYNNQWNIKLNNQYQKLTAKGLIELHNLATCSPEQLAKLGYVRTYSKVTKSITITKQ